MAVSDEDLRQVKIGTAILVATLVKTITDHADPEFKGRFLERLGQAYGKHRNEHSNLNGHELLNWTRELISGFNLVEGQKEPFFRDRE